MKVNNIDFETYLKDYPDDRGYFGKYGGCYIDRKTAKSNAGNNRRLHLQSASLASS